MQKHLMIDIETMSRRPEAAILSIGAILFDPHHFQEPEELCKNPTFNQTISIESNEREGRHIDGGTVAWWLRQSKEAQDALFVDPTNLQQGLQRFVVWANNLDPKFVWANSPSFDLVILKNACEQLNVRWPWQYWAERDVRTAKDLAFPNGDCPQITHGIAHGALDDAIKQAEIIQICYAKLNMSHL